MFTIFSKVLVSQLRVSVNISQQYLVSRRRHSGTKCICRTATYTTTITAGDTDKPKKSRKSKTKQDSDVTSSMDKSTSDSQKKKKKRGRKVLSEEEILDSLIGPSIPFEGIAEKNSAFEHANLSFEKQDSPDGRFYRCQTSTNSYAFPSVTTVLDKTGTRSYPLLIWKRKLVEEHGKEGFEAIRKNTLKSGNDFHKVRCTPTSQKNPQVAGPSPLINYLTSTRGFFV